MVLATQIPDYSNSNEAMFNEMTRVEQITFLSKQVILAMRHHPKYYLCFLGAMVNRLISVLFSVFLLLWITSFVQSGTLASDEDAKKVF